MEIEHSHQPMERNLALELVRVTEAAAMAAARYLGRGDKILVDEAAVAAMRYTLGYIQMDGIVVIGEGEKDHAPMLYIGERIGNGSDLKVDIAVDPIDGTTLVVRGLPGAISVVALASQGTMHCPMQCVYMNKIVTGPEAKDCIDINASVAENLKNIAKAKQRGICGSGLIDSIYELARNKIIGQDGKFDLATGDKRITVEDNIPLVHTSTN